MSRALRSGFLLVFVVFAASCGAPTEATWRVRFSGDGGVVGESAVRVRLRVLVDSCESTAVVYDADIARDESVPPFGEIGEGTFAFEATARDAECRIVARGCVVRALPPVGGDIVTVLEAVSPALPACAASACAEGRCASTRTDAGVP